MNETKEGKTFGDRLRMLRQRRHVSQQVVADFCVVSKNSIQNYEAGKQQPTGPVLLRMAEYFGTTVDYLLGYEKQ